MNCVVACSRSGYEALERVATENPGCAFTFIREPHDLTAALLDELQPEFVFFAHWSTVIPTEIHTQHECVIFHMTDLPYGRGGSPLQNLIVRGHRETTLSAIRCVDEIDAGEIYLQRPLRLDGSAREIFGRASEQIAEMIGTILRERPVPRAQVGEIVRFARRTPEQSDISTLAHLDAVYDHIRMLDADGYPHAFLDVGSMRLEFTDALRHGSSVEAHVVITDRSVE